MNRATSEPSRHGDIVAHLSRTEVLKLLPPPLIERLACKSQVISLPTHGTLCRPGDPPAAFVITHGRIASLTRTRAGVETHLFIHRPGQLVGASSLFLGKQPTEARALTPAVIIALDAEALHAAVTATPAASLALTKLLAERLAVAEARLGEVATQEVKDRLLPALARLAADVGVADSGGRLLPDWLTRDYLASAIGAGREIVSRALGKLRREGLIEIIGRRILVRGKTKESEK